MTDRSSARLEVLRTRLVESRDAARAVLDHASRGRPVEASGGTIGRLTRMDALQVEAMSQMNRYQLEIRLRRIEAALQAWEDGRYGICRECGEPVALSRLEALPEAPFCMPCQESFED